MGRWSNPKGGKGGPWEESQEGRFWFATASCELLFALLRGSSLSADLSSSVLENQEGWWAFKSPNTIWSTQNTRRVSKLRCSSRGTRTLG